MCALGRNILYEKILRRVITGLIEFVPAMVNLVGFLGNHALVEIWLWS